MPNARQDLKTGAGLGGRARTRIGNGEDIVTCAPSTSVGTGNEGIRAASRRPAVREDARQAALLDCERGQSLRFVRTRATTRSARKSRSSIGSASYPHRPGRRVSKAALGVPARSARKFARS